VWFGVPVARLVADGAPDRLPSVAAVLDAQVQRNGSLSARVGAAFARALVSGDGADVAEAVQLARRWDRGAHRAIVLTTLGAEQAERAVPAPTGADGWDRVTPAETAVLRLLADGHRNGAIAERLVVSKRTVESHVSSLLRKLDVPSRVALAVEARRRGIVGGAYQ
jgi:DNA-binding NarL/FixJ family response regulator